MTSQNFFSNCLSLDSLKVRVRCGLMSLAAHKRWTVAFDTPALRAMVRQLHRPSVAGGVTTLSRTTRAACGVLQSGQTVGEKPLAPKVDRYPRYADTRGDLVLRHPRRAEDHNLRPLPVAHGHRRRVDPAFQLAALFATQYNLAARHRFPQLLGPQHVQRHHACQAISETLH